MSDPRRVFNVDESAFFLYPPRGKVIAKKGDKSVYNIIGGSERDCVTVLIGSNAAGERTPPFILYKYVRLPQSIKSTLPQNWACDVSKSGWMTGETFFNYVANVFLPWVLSQNIQLPIVLFIDGHSSHMTLSLGEFCKDAGIILIALCPNATHVLQPMDVGYFRSLKRHWKIHRDIWTKNNRKTTFKREHVPPVLEAAMISTNENQNIIQNAFRKCGKLLLFVSIVL